MGQPLHQGQREPLGDAPHREQHGEGVAPLGLRPETGRGEGRDGPYELLPAQLQGQQTPQRVAGHVRAVQLQRLEQGAQHGVGRGQVVVEAARQARGRAEARQVHGDHVALGREDVHDRVPGLAVMAYAVQQDQRLTAPHARVADGHVLRAVRSGDLEGDGGGHGGAPRLGC
ncbi:hypothetical protein AQI88_31910 [Streptomyces cellostaticus]|uniref:Uncharacterized protein n=1 Tax=Streptomyces cellostaticus TaxID=67285 RepID=A0A101NGC9_9ACTN|nr:hypothetical protein AQI88_31910 [Streptomyces cellostaticus]